MLASLRRALIGVPLPSEHIVYERLGKAQALLVALKDGLTSDAGRLFEAAAGKVPGGQAPGLVHDVNEYRRAIGIEAALGLGDIVST